MSIDTDPASTASLERVGPREHRRGAFGSLAVALAWVALAAWRPESTYHLAPLVAAGAWPWLLRRGPLRVAPRDAALGAVAATALTIVVGVGLALVGRLDGPTLWGSGHALVEVVIAAPVGATVGYRYARCGVAPLR